MANNMQAITDNLDLWTSALLTKSAAGRGNGGKVEAYGIKKLRELILELAVRGKLVPQVPDGEPASVLLERIGRERTRLAKKGEINKEKSLPEIGETEKPFALPNGWEWSRLQEVEGNSGNSGDIIRIKRWGSKRICIMSPEFATNFSDVYRLIHFPKGASMKC